MASRDPLMTVRELAAYLQLSYDRTLDLIHAEEANPGSGIIASHIGNGAQKVYRIRPRDADRFLDSRRSAA
jgi:hypothetical protein